MTIFRSSSAFSLLRLLLGVTTLTALLAIAGCNDVPHSDIQESVDFTSTPSHANVSMDKQVLWTTPCSAILPKQTETHIVISKPGFTPVDVYVHAEGGSLVPNPVDVKLRTDLLPDKPGADPKAELATCLENLKKYVAAGTIAPEDAAYVEAQIREFYK